MSGARILLTNDDGVHAPGLLALAKAMGRAGELQIVAPADEMSATGHSLSLNKKQAIRPHKIDGRIFGHGFEGTPADCVKFAVAEWLEEPPDLVVSGINPGPNFGTNVPYSGTVAAAVEAAMLGIPGMAVSVGPGRPETDEEFASAARVAARLALEILRHGMAPGTALNVNVPRIAEDEIRGFRIVPQGGFRIRDHYQSVEQAEDGARQWINVGAEHFYSPEGEQTDDWAVRHGYVSITPLWYDMTAYDQLEVWKNRLPCEDI